MIFNSVDFLFFFPIVVISYFVIPDKLKNTWLLICSYYFYMCWNPQYSLLLLFSTVITYGSGMLLAYINGREGLGEDRDKCRKMTVFLSFLINLLILFLFKYLNFALDTIDHTLKLLGTEWATPQFDFVLPVGISFYTFQALSYTMDVYRGEISAEKNFVRYALFVSFFPQLVAGPIEKSKNLLIQLKKPAHFNFEQAREGLMLMLWGFFLKIVIADRAAIFVDCIYSDYQNYAGWYLIVATLLFAVQIYCDFYGYSVIAKGAAQILGIRLMENFRSPYLSKTIGEFWKNWHISLTSWFRDYLYIPLGGNKKGKHRKYINKMIVFLVSGLWHGASLSFLLWGG